MAKLTAVVGVVALLVLGAGCGSSDTATVSTTTNPPPAVASLPDKEACETWDNSQVFGPFTSNMVIKYISPLEEISLIAKNQRIIDAANKLLELIYEAPMATLEKVWGSYLKDLDDACLALG